MPVTFLTNLAFLINLVAVTFLSNLLVKGILNEEIKSKNIILEKYESELMEMKEELNNKNIELDEQEDNMIKLEGELDHKDLELERMNERVRELNEIITLLHNQNAPKGAGFECQKGQPLRTLNAQWCKLRDADIQEKDREIMKIRHEIFILYFIVISLSILYYLRM